MGAAHIAKVFALWADLPDRPFRLLVHMALVAPDAHAAPRYYGGRAAMAIALGLDPTDPSSARMVTATATRLVEAGAIERDGNTGFRGKRMEYSLTLDRGTPQSPKKRGKGDSTVRERVTPQSGKGDSTVTERVTPQSPQGLLRSTRSDEEEQNSSPKVTQESAMPTAANDGEMSQLEARRIVREHTDDGGHELRKHAPLTIPRADLDVWCARQILASKESA